MRLLLRAARSRVPDGVFLFFGAALVCGAFVETWEFRWWLEQERKEREKDLQAPRPARVWRRVEIEKDGTPRVHSRHSDKDVVEITDLDGTPVATVTKREAVERDVSCYVLDFWWSEEPREVAYCYRYSGPWDKLAWGRKHSDGWFYLRDTGWLVRYDKRTRRPDLYVSPGGPRDSPPGPDDRFRKEPGWRTVRAREGESKRAVSGDERLFVFREAPPHEMRVIYRARTKRFDVGSVPRWGVEPGTTVRRFEKNMFVVLDGNDVMIMDPEGNVETTFAVPESILRRGRTQVRNAEMVADPVVVLLEGRDGEPNRDLVFDREGNQIAEHEWPVPRYEEEEANMGRRNAIIFMLALFPVFAGLCLWHARRNALALWKTIAWSAFVFLTGPMGAAVYFGVQDFAPLVECPSCEGRRPADRRKCPRCSAAFEPSARTGIEIIEEV